MRSLSVSSFASAAGTAGAAGAAGAWSLTLLIQIRMNSWKKSLFDAGARAGADSGPRDAGPGAGRLMASLLRRVEGIVESGERRATEWRAKSDSFCLPNRLVEQLWELLEL